MKRMRTHPTRRRGLSLLEVLISAFVMSVGILSLLALIPVGGHQIAEANKLDRASTLGRAAFREIQVQGLLEPNRWMWANATDPGGDWLWDLGTTPAWENPANHSRNFPALTLNQGVQNVDDWGFPVCIDPLLISSGQQLAASDWPAQAFPYYPQPWSGAPFIPRVTITTPGNLPNPSDATRLMPISFGAAERIFTSQDDPTFTVSETDPTERPERLYTEDGSYRRLRGQWDGEFSWMMIASRPMSEIALAPNPVVPIPSFRYDIAPERRNTYDVSVLVFHRRNLDATITSSQMGFSGAVPSERVCRIFFGAGSSPVDYSPGGGSAALSMQGTTPTTTEISNWLSVKPDQWIGVTFWKQMPTQLFNAGVGAPEFYPVIRWYKVLSVGSLRAGFGLPITLAGPDWNIDEVASINGSQDAYAIILDNLVGVYQKTITRQ